MEVSPPLEDEGVLGAELASTKTFCEESQRLMFEE